MKWTAKRIAYLTLQVLFAAVVPFILVVSQYGSIGSAPAQTVFKIGMTGIMLVGFIFWVVKKTMIDKKLSNLQQQANVMLAKLKTGQDPAEISAIEKELKFIKSLEAITSAVLPAIVIGLSYVCFKALEVQIVKLSATLGMIGISYVISVIFGVLYSRQIERK